MNLFITQAHAQAVTQAPGGQAPKGAELFQFGFLIVLFAVFYLVAIRPQRKRQKEHQEMVAALAVGDEVATSAGILGKVKKLEEDYVILKVSETVELKFQRGSVHAVLPKGTLKSIGS